ncbi:MAG: hypothetical protein PF505_05240 [Vallitaleaceae bacterium]|jgi:DNA mismatch repair protein MutS|nr:hypothetical protein [Vallitaleaceae bacterium]
MMFNDTYHLSLLWKKGAESCFVMDDQNFDDLNMNDFLNLYKPKYQDEYRAYLKNIPTDIETIVYRQGIMSDIIDNDFLLDVFKEAGDKCAYMSSLVKFAYERDATVYNLLKRIEESEHVMTLVEYLYKHLSENNILSEGLVVFRDMLKDIIYSDIYTNYKDDMGSIKKMDGRVRSIKIGMNFDENLKPVEAIVLSLDEQPFRYTRAFKQTGRMIGGGIKMLRRLPRRIFAPETLIPTDELSVLEQLLEPALKQLIQFCDLFNQSLLSFMEEVLEDITFYNMLHEFFRLMVDNNVPVTKPVFGDHIDITSFCNVNLLSKMIKTKTTDQMVYNNFATDEGERCFILTGANRGGKTTITQGIGQICLMGQLGAYIPAKTASLKAIDGLYLLFPTKETISAQYGRLGEECKRFSDIFGKLTSGSLLLMNETFVGTSHLESLVIAKETMKALYDTKCMVLYNTHLHELVTELATDDDQRSFISLVNGSEAAHGSFVMRRAEPLGKSYAIEIAHKYGVSYEQLIGQS